MYSSCDAVHGEVPKTSSQQLTFHTCQLALDPPVFTTVFNTDMAGPPTEVHQADTAVPISKSLPRKHCRGTATGHQSLPFFVYAAASRQSRYIVWS